LIEGNKELILYHIDLRVRELGDATEFYREFSQPLVSPNRGRRRVESNSAWEPFPQNHFSDLPRSEPPAKRHPHRLLVNSSAEVDRVAEIIHGPEPNIEGPFLTPNTTSVLRRVLVIRAEPS